MPKEANQDSSVELIGDSSSVCSVVDKVQQKTALRCVLCTALIGSDKAKQTYYHCPICTVHLCTTLHGNQRSTCFQRWHCVGNLAGCKKDATVSVKKKGSTKKPGKKRSVSNDVTLTPQPQQKSPRLSRMSTMVNRLRRK